jgi:choline dehydrogenase-like flavoprotein
MLCPIDSKFTIENELSGVYADPRVTVRYGAAVQQVDVEGGRTATGVRFLDGDVERSARGDLVALGANALFNPHILLRSGLAHPELGAGLMEQVAKIVRVDLDGVDNFQGSTVATGHGYMLYGGQHRRERAAALIETSNRPDLRNGRGKWRQVVLLRVVYEDLRRSENRVDVDPDDPSRPRATFNDHSTHAHRGMDALASELERILAPLPVENIRVPAAPVETESHILGTTPMGDDPAHSVVDRHLLHHQVRNLLVLGGSVFPTAAPANPTLTLSALAVRAADHVTGRAPA